MRVPLSWLNDFVKLPADVTPEALAERLTIAGMEVDKIMYIGVAQHTERHGFPPSDHLVWKRDKILLGYIREVKAHPNADKLVLAVVDYGADQTETVVTGAPNLFEYKEKGPLPTPLLTPFALEGAEVIDGHGDGVQRMILQEKELRGIPNRCMVCSEMELGISDEHEGIMLLDYHEFSQYTPGTPFVDVMGDVVLDIELTPSFARCFSILGIAREVAALYDVELLEPDYNLPVASGDSVKQAAAIQITDPSLNPRFTAALLRNINIGPSPVWMQWRLRLVGQRPINNIVDISNYVMFEIGQPTHAFDYDILKTRAESIGESHATIVTRLPENGERLTTLDGKDHELKPHHLLVADKKGGLSLAGLMGGLESEVQAPNAEHGAMGSQTILLESASWNFINLRKTISDLNLHSEAGKRFSRGVHPAMAMRGLARGVQLMVDIVGAELAPDILDEYPKPTPVVIVDLHYQRLIQLLGFEIPYDEVIAILKRLEFGVEEIEQQVLRVSVPDHRLDISDDPIIGQADLVEEVARIYGYNRIPDTTMADELPPQVGNPDLMREERVRDLLVQAGLREVINYRFVTPSHEAGLTPNGVEASWPKRAYVEIANTISVERSALRQTLLCGLLDNAYTNKMHHPRQLLFEIGAVFYANEDGRLPDEPRHLGILMTGPQSIGGWIGNGSNHYLSFYDLKGVIETLLDGLRIPTAHMAFTRTQHNSFHPGRTALLTVQGEAIGVFGEVHPLVLEAFGLDFNIEIPILAAEFDLDMLLKYANPGHQVKSLPIQPEAYRDIAIVVEAERPAAAIEAVIWQSGTDLLKAVRLFDVYEGDPIPEGYKSLAYALTYQTDEQTLTDKIINKVHKGIVDALDQVGAKLRA